MSERLDKRETFLLWDIVYETYHFGSVVPNENWDNEMKPLLQKLLDFLNDVSEVCICEPAF